MVRWRKRLLAKCWSPERGRVLARASIFEGGWIMSKRKNEKRKHRSARRKGDIKRRTELYDVSFRNGMYHRLACKRRREQQKWDYEPSEISRHFEKAHWDASAYCREARMLRMLLIPKWTTRVRKTISGKTGRSDRLWTAWPETPGHRHEKGNDKQKQKDMERIRAEQETKRGRY